MAARALLGITIGGFWSLATATVMRLVPEHQVPKALGVIYMGNAVATAFAAPIRSYLGGIIGWRGVFWALVPLVVGNLVWQWKSLPVMAPQVANPVGKLIGLLKRRHVAFGMAAVMLTFGGAFAAFTYLRPFLENYAHVTVPQLSLLLLGLGMAGFVGTYAASALVGRHLYRLMAVLPLALGLVTLVMLAGGHTLWAVAPAMIAWGGLNSAIPVAWSTWLSQAVADEPESGGGLMVGAIQLAIMLGAALGGVLLDHISIAAALIGGSFLLVLAAMTARAAASKKTAAPNKRSLSSPKPTKASVTSRLARDAHDGLPNRPARRGSRHALAGLEPSPQLPLSSRTTGLERPSLEPVAPTTTTHYCFDSSSRRR